MTVIATFRSDMRPLARILIRKCLWGTAAAIVAIIIVRTPQGRLSILEDLFLLTLPAALCLLAGLFFFALARLQTVQILTTGLRCYDPRGRYHVVRWQDISSVELQYVYGLPYLYIKAKAVSNPITLPLWLHGMKDFVDLAERQGGRENILVAALRAAT